MCLEGGVLFFVNAFLFRGQILQKKITIGKISGFFLLFYSIFRFFLEYLRSDSQMEFIGIFTKSQWFFVFTFVISLWFLMYFAPKHEENL
jgi:phosphatidylglycerol:prolipoprotein diacylglycerol transferase